MNIDLALEKIYSLKQFHVKLGLDNITHLLNHLSNPQEKLKIFHIAGSNGKGSTASFISSILQEYGFKVGLYTSPHFVNFNERIRINGNVISDEYIIDFLEQNKNYIDENKPTFFEIATALAFQYFMQENVEYAVMETGLGGRLDATNTVHPLVSIITSISIEHSKILGDTIEKIAYEKAGIIKMEVPVFVGKLPDKAKDVVKNISKQKESKFVDLNEFITEKSDSIKLRLKNKNININRTGLLGKHQLLNSALAIKVVEIILFLDNHKLFFAGLDNVVKNTGIQGRFEVFNDYPKVILDSAHNPEGVESFVNQFKTEYNNYDETILIYGAMNDKSNRDMLLSLHKYFSKIFVTSSDYERSASASELLGVASKLNVNVEKIANPEKYIKQFITSNNKSCLVILGSIYLLGEIKKKIINS